MIGYVCSGRMVQRAAVAIAACTTLFGGAVAAQTVTLRSIKDGTIRGGSYANTRYGTDTTLETRQSSDSSYVRRALLMFDTETTVPDNATITSARLLLTVKDANPETRQLRAYSVPVSFEESDLTWTIRKGSTKWQNPGGDVVDGYVTGTVTSTVGSQVAFDVTSQVQKVIKGTYGSRYARFMVADMGSSSRDSYKAYYSDQTSDATKRPTLIVTYGSSGSGATDTTTSGKALKVLQWNTHHGGYGTDGKYDTNRLANWVVKMNPDIVMFNEIEKYTSWGNEDQPAKYKSLLQSKTGKTWYAHFAQEYGQWSANGKGNLILSTIPFNSTDRYELVHNGDRSISEATITYNGRNITLVNTHLDPDSSTLRLTQAKEVTSWASGEAENRIVTGDFNAWPDQTSIAEMNSKYYDSWTVAVGKGTAITFSGNNGETKKGRIDYIFYSHGASGLSVKSSQVFDTRDSNGVMPSDHRPVLTTFLVK